MTEEKSNQDSLQKIISDTKNLLSFHDACNLTYPLTGELQSFLRPKLLRQEKKKAQASSLGSARTSALSSPAVQKDTTFHNKDLETKRPELLIISDWDYSGKISSGFMSNEARELLTKMLTAIQLSWEDVCIYPIVKSPPASDREPSKDEVQSCLPSLLRKVEILRPKVICAMGKISSQHLLKSGKQLFALRGKFYSLLNIPLMPTFHPALLLKHPELKKASWQDLQSIRQKINAVS
jgi:uracil-DNA glycosylase family 4